MIEQRTNDREIAMSKGMIHERVQTLVGTNFNLYKCIEIRVSVVPES